MIECPMARRMLADEPDDPALQAHLRHCPGCRREAAFEDRIRAAVEAMPRRQAPESLAAGVMAALTARSSPAVPRRRSPGLALRPWEAGGLALSAAGLLCLLSWLFPSASIAWPAEGFAAWLAVQGHGLWAQSQAFVMRVGYSVPSWHAVDFGAVRGGMGLLILAATVAFTLALFLLLCRRGPFSDSLWEEARG